MTPPQPVILDVTGLVGPDAAQTVKELSRALREHNRAEEPVILRGHLGLSGESRSTTVGAAQAIWEMYEEYHPELEIAFPRLPDDHFDPIANPPEGMPVIPVSPTGVPKETQELALWELRTLRQLLGVRRGLSSTRKVIINLTYKCNNYCTFCAVGNRMHENGDYAFHRKTLEDYRAKGVDLVDFDGGEPTIYPNLLNIIRYSKELGYQAINITTNGRTLAYPHIAKKILSSGLTSLLISCHGADAKVHDEQVQSKGAFRQTLKGIQTVLKMKPSWMDFGVNITLTNTNWQCLPEYYAIMDRLGVRKINIQFLTPFGRAEENLVPDPAEIAPTIMGLLDMYSERIKTYLINVPWCFFPGYERFVVGDVLKLQRNMVFVTQEKVNLFDYLAGTRERTDQCEDCVFSVACDGFYSFDETFD